MKKCPYCMGENKNKVKICTYCGRSFPKSSMTARQFLVWFIIGTTLLMSVGAFIAKSHEPEKQGSTQSDSDKAFLYCLELANANLKYPETATYHPDETEIEQYN